MSDPSVRELVILESDPTAVGAARRFVSGCLAGLADDAVATAELVVSELVTNAVLHAGTALRVGVQRRDEVVRLEIDDHDDRRPAAKNYSPDAGTGRGLRLVEALTRAWGVDCGPAGKTVWAEVPLSAEPRSAPDLVDVHLRCFPVPVYARAAEHSDELQREFALLLERDPEQGSGTPGQLLAVVREVQERFGRFGAEAARVVSGAVDGGTESLADLVYRVPAESGAAAARLARLLEEADVYCRAGDLLTLAAPPEARAFRRWFLGQFESQTRGRAPVAWPEWTGRSPTAR